VLHAQPLCSVFELWCEVSKKHDDCEWRNGKEESLLVETYCTTVFPEETEKSHDIFYLTWEMHDYILLYFVLTLKCKESVTHLKMTKLYDSIFRPYFNSAFRTAVRLRFITVLAEIRFPLQNFVQHRHNVISWRPRRLSISLVFLFLVVFSFISSIKLA
jgi:hypothetical protein